MEFVIRVKLLLSGLLLSSVTGIFGSDEVVPGQNSIASAIEVIVAASPKEPIDRSLSFVY